MNKVQALVYILMMAALTIGVYVFMPFSVTAVIMSAAFIVNLFLLLDVFRKGK